jgi:hypothetical protein
LACRTTEIRQRDTYFTVPRGGLKLREEQPGRPHLIQFERASEPQQRESRYRIAEVDDAEALRAALTAALGTTVVVCKPGGCSSGAMSVSTSTPLSGWGTSSRSRRWHHLAPIWPRSTR